MEHSDQEVFIQNDSIRVGINLSSGGAVTYVATLDGPNIINSFDWGRQIQQSYYSGPANYTREGKEKGSHWASYCWNPIQSGDSFGNGSQVLELKRSATMLYVKTRPMLWPMRDDVGECVFETGIALNGATFTWRARLTNQRSDQHWYGAHPQELPAIYTNGPWHRLISYTGDAPYTGDATVEIRNDHHESWPWVEFIGSECWAALLDAQDEGIGVWHPTAQLYHGGFAGDARGDGGANDFPTGYMAPIRSEILDNNIVFEYLCVFIVGSLRDIRAFAGAHAPVNLPHWKFSHNRAGWTYQNARDNGWPIHNGLVLQSEQPGTIRLISPITTWQAKAAQRITVRARFPKGDTKSLRIYWRGMPVQPASSGNEWAGWSRQWWESERSAELQIKGDGRFHWYSADVSNHPDYCGLLTGLAIDIPDCTPDTPITIREVMLIAGETTPK